LTRLEIKLDPKTGKPMIVVEADIPIKKLIEQIGKTDLAGLVEQLYTVESKQSATATVRPQDDVLSSFKVVDKIKLILSKLTVGWHTTAEVKEEYEREFKEEIAQATISQNMKRLLEKEILERRPTRRGNSFEYRVENQEKLNESLNLLEESV